MNNKWLAIGLLFLLTACQAAGQPQSPAMLRAGDQINGLSLAKGASAAPVLWAFCSSSQDSAHSKTFNCSAPVLPTLAIGHIFLIADETLTSMGWSNLAWELSIDDQSVDLDSFGKFDYVIPSMSKSPSAVREVFKKATGWNIVLTNLNPGQHTLRFVAHTNTDRYSWLVNLAIEGVDGGNISSVPFPPKF